MREALAMAYVVLHHGFSLVPRLFTDTRCRSALGGGTGDETGAQTVASVARRIETDRRGPLFDDQGHRLR